MQINALGKHLIIEMLGCPFRILDDQSVISAALIDTAKALGATILGSQFHKFAPQGVSGYILIAESHLSIHTWPEFGYATIDIFTCGQMNPYDGLFVLTDRLCAIKIKQKMLYRGVGGVTVCKIPAYIQSLTHPLRADL